MLAKWTAHMSELEDAWVNIKESLEILMGSNPTPGQFNLEFAQKRSRVLHGMGKLKNDVDFFLKHAPAGDARRAGVTRLKELMLKTEEPD
jgi:hypothetical protein